MGKEPAKFTGPMVVRRQLKNIPTDIDYRAEAEGGPDEEVAPGTDAVAPDAVPDAGEPEPKK